jgi:hypothetical protein
METGRPPRLLGLILDEKKDLKQAAEELGTYLSAAPDASVAGILS